MSRTVVDVLCQYDLYSGNIMVENREGGSGAVGFSCVSQREGDPYRLTTTSDNLIGTPLAVDTDWTCADFILISLLASDAMLPVDSADSDFGDLDAFVTTLTSGSVDAVVSNPSEVAGQLEAGTRAALSFLDSAWSTNKPEVLTFTELGYDFSFPLS
ncbi:MAG: hypothetical protein AAF141_13955 [Pseudomonadota bacterium]